MRLVTVCAVSSTDNWGQWSLSTRPEPPPPHRPRLVTCLPASLRMNGEVEKVKMTKKLHCKASEVKKAVSHGRPGLITKPNPYKVTSFSFLACLGQTKRYIAFHF